jgi:hypothetical protein
MYFKLLLIKKKMLTKEELQFKNLLKLNCPTIKFTTLAKKCYVESMALKNYIQIQTFPTRYFSKILGSGTDKGKIFYLLSDVMNFIHYSVNDNKLGCFTGPGIILWRNPHYVIDFHKPMKWYNEKTKLNDYSEQVLILVDIIENICDKYEIRGTSEYRLSECTTTNYRVDYYIDLIIKPLIIEINEKHHKQKTSEAKMDVDKDKLSVEFEIIQIDADRWSNKKYKERCINFIELTIKESFPDKFIKSLLERSEIVKDIMESIGKDIVTSLITGSDFPFPLKQEVLPNFGVEINSQHYLNTFEMFEQIEDNEIEDNDDLKDDFNDNIEEEEQDDFNDDIEEEEQDDFNDDIQDDDIEYNNIDNIKISNNDVFKLGIDYKYDEITNEIYINQFALNVIATKIGLPQAMLYQRKVHELQQYIQKFGKIASEELTKLCNKLKLSSNERQNRWKIINEFSEIETATKLSAERRENRLIEKENNLLKRELDKYKLHFGELS